MCIERHISEIKVSSFCHVRSQGQGKSAIFAPFAQILRPVRFCHENSELRASQRPRAFSRKIYFSFSVI